MHDAAPAHNRHFVSDYFDCTFHGRLIANDGPIIMAIHPQDLSPTDSILWCHLETLVYLAPVDRKKALLTRILEFRMAAINFAIRQLCWEVFGNP